MASVVLVNMDRRKFLAASGAGVASLFAGCMGFGGDGGDEQYDINPDQEQHDLGDAVEYGGLRFTVDDPVLADHYGPYDCGGRRIWEDDDAQECSPPEIDDFEEPPTQGGQFMALQITVEHVGQRRIQLPIEEENFDLANAGYAEDEFLIETPWVSAQEVFPSWVFFLEEHQMDEQGVFPGVGVRGYIAFEVPIQSDHDEYTAVIRWAGNEEEEQEVYWNITSDAVDDLTEAEPPEHGGDVFYEPRAGGVDWGEDGQPDHERGEGINWRFDGDGDYHVPDSQVDGEDEEEDGDEDDDGIDWD